MDSITFVANVTFTEIVNKVLSKQVQQQENTRQEKKIHVRFPMRLFRKASAMIKMNRKARPWKSRTYLEVRSSATLSRTGLLSTTQVEVRFEGKNAFRISRTECTQVWLPRSHVEHHPSEEPVWVGQRRTHWRGHGRDDRASATYWRDFRTRNKQRDADLASSVRAIDLFDSASQIQFFLGKNPLTHQILNSLRGRRLSSKVKLSKRVVLAEDVASNATVCPLINSSVPVASHDS